jgi:hypothetical protein
VSATVREGSTAIPDSLLEAVIAAGLPGRHLALVLAVVRLTYGWPKRSEISAEGASRRIGAGLLARLVGIDSRRARRILADLEAWGLVTRSAVRNGQTPTVKLWRDPARWHIADTAAAVGQRTRAKHSPGQPRPPDPGYVRPPDPGYVEPPSTYRETIHTQGRERVATISPDLYGRLAAAAASYGVTWPASCPPRWAEVIADRQVEDRLGDGQLVACVHGYTERLGTAERGEMVPLAHLYPPTIFAADKWPANLAAWESKPRRPKAVKPPDAAGPAHELEGPLLSDLPPLEQARIRKEAAEASLALRSKLERLRLRQAVRP